MMWFVALLTALHIASSSKCDLAGAALCNEPGGLTWFGGNRTRPPTPLFAVGCCLPSVRDTVAALTGVHVLMLGDSTFRYPVQFFQRVWLGCEPGRQYNITAAIGEERKLCEPPFFGKTWLHRPLGGFYLNNEFVTHVQGLRQTKWWRRWVLGNAYKTRLSGATQKIPDAVVMGAWLWHAKIGRASFREYEARLRTFLIDLVARPSYREWWSQGRLYWREALPTEHAPPYDSASCEEANAVARRVLAELAPNVRVLSLAHVVTRSSSTSNGSVAMTMDGKHFQWPVQVALLQTALGVLVRDGVVNVSQAVAESLELR